jgi:hypothetical protein
VDCAVHVYNCTPIMCHNWKTPFENLEHTKPDVTHLRVFGCSAYVFLPKEVGHNKLNPKSKLMTFIGYPQGIKGYLLMRSVNNVLFTAVQALFDETLYPKCPDMHCPGYTPAPDPPVGKQSEYNISPDDDEFCGNGGGPLPPFGPAGGPRPQLPPWQPPQSGYPPLPPSPLNHPSPSLSQSRSSSVLSYQDPPKLVYSRAPSPEPFVYDPDQFNSIEEQRAYLEQKAFEEELARNRPVRSGSQEDREYYCHLAEAFKQATGLKRGRSDDPWVEGFMETYRPNLHYQWEPSLPAQPQKGLSGSQPRRSGCARQPVVCPDNIYGNQNPIESEWMSNQGFQRLMEGVPAPSRSSNRPESPPYEGKGKQKANYLA